MPPADIKALLQQFVIYTTTPGEKKDETLLKLCDRIVTAYHEVCYTFDNRTFPQGPTPEPTGRRETISALFPDYGYYCLTSPKMGQFTSDAMVGDSIDDLSDLTCDFEEVIWCFDHTNTDDALWHFNTGYWQHWGHHMRELQLYLFRRVTGT